MLDNTLNEIIPYAFFFIFIIFLLAKKKAKKEVKQEQRVVLIENQDDKLEVLQNAETKLIALKDLYKQELIDANIYLEKTEVVAKNISKEIGKDIMDFPKIQQKIIFNDLKKEIKKKINYGDEKNVKNNLDNLISAVDNKIKDGTLYEEK